MSSRVAAAFVVCAVVSVLCGCTAAAKGEIKVGGRILLIHPGAGGDQTDFAGVIGENAAHCITVGRFVLYAPAGSKLLADGSVVVGSHTWKVGTFVRVGGSQHPGEPKGSPCNAGDHGYWAPNPDRPSD